MKQVSAFELELALATRQQLVALVQKETAKGNMENVQKAQAEIKRRAANDN